MAAHDIRREMLEWCRRDRDYRSDFVRMIEAGTMTTRHDVGNGWVDTTQTTLSMNKAKIAEIDAFIAKGEAELSSESAKLS